MRAKKPKPPLERDVSKAITEHFALAYRIELHRRNTATFFKAGRKIQCAAKGQADRYGIIPPHGRAIEIEVKRVGEEPDEDQSDWLEACRAKGAVAFWADSVEMAEEKYIEQAREVEVWVGASR